MKVRNLTRDGRTGLPGDELEVYVVQAPGDGYAILASAGKARRLARRAWAHHGRRAVVYRATLRLREKLTT